MTKYLTLALALTLAACGGEEGDTTVIYMGGAATGGTTAETGGTTAETGGTTAETGGTTTETGGTSSTVGGVATGGTSEIGGTATGGTTTGGTSTTLPCDAAYLSLSQEEKCYQYAISVDPSLNPKILETTVFLRTTTEACGIIKDQCGHTLNCGTCENSIECGAGDLVGIVRNNNILFDGHAHKTQNLCQGGCLGIADSDACDQNSYNWSVVCAESNTSIPNQENGTCTKATKTSRKYFNSNIWCCNKP